MVVVQGVFFFIYVRKSFGYFHFYALLFTTLTFLFLVFEAGKQKVYQDKLLKKREFGLSYENLSTRKNGWRFGLVFYSMAIPYCIASNIIYWVPFNEHFGAKIKGFPALRHDIYNNHILFYEESVDSQWRDRFVDYSTIIPFGCIFLEFLFGKLIIPFNQIIVSLVFVLFFLGYNWNV